MNFTLFFLFFFTGLLMAVARSLIRVTLDQQRALIQLLSVSLHQAKEEDVTKQSQGLGENAERAGNAL